MGIGTLFGNTKEQRGDLPPGGDGASLNRNGTSNEFNHLPQSNKAKKKQKKTLKLFRPIKGMCYSSENVKKGIKEFKANKDALSKNSSEVEQMAAKLDQKVTAAKNSDEDTLSKARQLVDVIVQPDATTQNYKEFSQPNPQYHEQLGPLDTNIKKNTNQKKISVLMNAAANRLGYNSKEIQENPTMLNSIKELLVIVRVELGRRFQDWGPEEVLAYVENAYSGKPAEHRKILKKLVPELSEEALHAYIKDEDVEETKTTPEIIEAVVEEQPEPDVVSKNEEYVEPELEIQAEQDEQQEQPTVKATAEEAAKEFTVKTDTKEDKKTHLTVQEVIKPKEIKELPELVKHSKEVLKLIKEDMKQGKSTAAKMNAFEEAVMYSPDLYSMSKKERKSHYKSLRKKFNLQNVEDMPFKFQAQFEAIDNMVSKKIKNMAVHQRTYLQGIVSELQAYGLAERESIEQIAEMKPSELKSLKKRIYAEYTNTGNTEIIQNIELVATQKLRDSFIDQLADINSLQEPVIQQLKGLDLEELTVSMTQQGHFILKFDGIDARYNMALADQTKIMYQGEERLLTEVYAEKQNLLVSQTNNPELLEKYTNELKDLDKHLPGGIAYLRTEENQSGFLMADYSNGEEVAYHELLHLIADLKREERIVKNEEHAISILQRAVEQDQLSPEFLELSEKKQKRILREYLVTGDLPSEYQHFEKNRYFDDDPENKRDIVGILEGMNEQLMSNRISEEIGTNLISLPEGQKFNLNMSGIREFDETNESHLSALVLTRFIKDQEGNPNFELSRRRLGMLLAAQPGELTLAKVSRFIRDIDSTDVHARTRTGGLQLRLVEQAKEDPIFEGLAPHKQHRFIEKLISGKEFKSEKYRDLAQRLSESEDFNLLTLLNEEFNEDNNGRQLNLNLKQANLIEYVFDVDGNIDFSTEGIFTQRENYLIESDTQNKKTRYAEFMVRQLADNFDSYDFQGNLGSKLPYSVAGGENGIYTKAFPFPWLGGGVGGSHPASRFLETLIPGGIPGTGLKFSESWAHIFPGVAKVLGADLTEKYNVLDKGLLPFGWSEHPSVSYLAKAGKAGDLPVIGKLLPKSARERKLSGTPFYDQFKPFIQKGIDERLQTVQQAAFGIETRKLGLDVKEVFLISEEAGGVSMDWYREKPNFTAKSWDTDDSYRNNRSFQYFLEQQQAKGIHVDATQLQRLGIQDTIALDNEGSTIYKLKQGEKVKKGTMTYGSLEDTLEMLSLGDWAEGDQPKGYGKKRLDWHKGKGAQEKIENLRNSFTQIGQAMMAEDNRQYKYGIDTTQEGQRHGDNYTIKDLIRTVAEVDTYGPFNPKAKAQNNFRQTVKVGDKNFNVEDVREFIVHYYLGRQKKVLALGAYGKDEFEFKKDQNGEIKVQQLIKAKGRDEIGYYKQLMADPRYTNTITDGGIQPDGSQLFLKNINKTTQDANGNTIDNHSYQYAIDYAKGVGVDFNTFTPDQSTEIEIYSEHAKIQKYNNVTGVPIDIMGVRGVAQEELEFAFGIKDTRVDSNGNQVTGLKAPLGIAYEYHDYKDETERGSMQYVQFMMRYAQTNRFRAIADQFEKVYQAAGHIEKIMRWASIAAIVLAFTNPALAMAGTAAGGMLFWNVVWSFTGSPLISNLEEKWGNRKGAAVYALGDFMREKDIFEKGIRERHSTTTLNMLDAHLKGIRKKWKDVASKGAEEFEWGSQNKIQAITKEFAKNLQSITSE